MRPRILQQLTPDSKPEPGAMQASFTCNNHPPGSELQQQQQQQHCSIPDPNIAYGGVLHSYAPIAFNSSAAQAALAWAQQYLRHQLRLQYPASNLDNSNVTLQLTPLRAAAMELQ